MPILILPVTKLLRCATIYATPCKADVVEAPITDSNMRKANQFTNESENEDKTIKPGEARSVTNLQSVDDGLLMFLHRVV